MQIAHYKLTIIIIIIIIIIITKEGAKNYPQKCLYLRTTPI